MNRRIGVYTNIDSLFDTRRALLSLLLTKGDEGLPDSVRKQKADSLWETHIEKSYKERRFDLFEYPGVGINRAAYDEVYAKRSVKDWLCCYPSNLLKKLVKIILEQESITDRPLDITGIDLKVNIFPFDFPEDMQADLLAYIKTGLLGFVNVELVNQDHRKLTALYYGRFNYVLCYDILTGGEHVTFNDSLPISPIPSTALLVPNILVEDSEFLLGTNDDRILRSGLMLSSLIRWIPIDHSVYDYASV